MSVVSEVDRLREENERLRARLAQTEKASKDEVPDLNPILRVLDNTPLAIFWKDRQLRYQGANRHFLRLAYLDDEASLVGRTDFELPWKDRADLYRRIDERIFEEGRPDVRTEKFFLPLKVGGRDWDGWARVTKAPIFDAQGAVIGVLGVAEDVTEQQRVEQAIRVLVQTTFTGLGPSFFRSMVRYLARSAGVRYALIGIPHPSDHRLIQALAFWDGEDFQEGLEFPRAGYPCGEVMGHHYCEFPEGLLERFPDAELLRPLEAESYLGASLFDSLGKPQGHLAVMDTRPMTNLATIKQILEMFSVRVSSELERKRIDEALRESRANLERRVEERTEDLATAHESLRSLLHIVSHDLRAPLVNLKGFAGELHSAAETIQEVMGAAFESVQGLPEGEQQRLRQVLGEDIPEALDFIDSSINRIDTFMSTLLKLSAQGRRELHMEWLNSNALVEETLKILAYQVEQRRAVVTVDRLPEVVADQISLEQIFSNLLSNAVLYLDPERPGRIQVSGERTHEHVLFRIEDNGRGIPKEDLSKLFLPFRRGRYTDVEGEGMGLAYVEALVRRHGGRIWCESEVGVGTTFFFTISTELMENDPRTGVHLLAPIQKILAQQGG
jgi:PAS domain S-box-containing protein